MAADWDPGELSRRMRERRFSQVLEDPPECSLTELRKSRRRSQATVAAILGVRQLAVSRLEHRKNLRLSTLVDYVAALDGTLELIVRFPGRAVRLTLC